MNKELLYEMLRILNDKTYGYPYKWIIYEDIYKHNSYALKNKFSPSEINEFIKYAIDSNIIEKTNDTEPFIRINENGAKLYYNIKKEFEVPNNKEAASTIVDRRTIFVVHGRNDDIRRSMFDFLRTIDLKPLEWSEAVELTKETSPYIGKILDSAFSKAQAVVVLLTPDDDAILREQFRKNEDPDYESKLTGQARPNVLFEAGMAMGRFQDRTIFVEVGKLRPFSDIFGRHTIKLNNTPQSRHNLVDRLKIAGCSVNTSGREWYDSGDFEICSKESQIHYEGDTNSANSVKATPELIISVTSSKLSHAAIDIINSVPIDGSVHVVNTSMYGKIVDGGSKFVNDLSDAHVTALYLDALDDLLNAKVIREESINHYKLTTLGWDIKKYLASSNK